MNETTRPGWPKRAWSAVWRITLFVVLFGVVYALLMLAVGLGPPDGSVTITPGFRLTLELLGAVAVIAVGWAMLRVIDRRSLVSLGFEPRGLARDLLLGLALGSAMILLCVATLWLPGWLEAVPVTNFSWAVLGMMGAAMLANSVTQEVMVRGYVLQTIETGFGVVSAVVVSSVLFAGLHAGAIVEGGLLAAINLLAAGVLLGLAYTTTRNLWLPIALHFSWNFLQGPVLGIAVTGQALHSGWRVFETDGPAIFTGGEFGLEGGLSATAATLLGIGALVALARGRDRRSALESPDAG